jgi:hypothetical protein
MICPICNSELVTQWGNQMHPNDDNYGVSVFCNNKECAAQEVAGHGDTAKQAYQIVREKFIARSDR